MIEIDGSYLEGGGQILRTSLGLSAATGKAFTVRGIRKKRPKPGLKPQHLGAVNAARALCGAEVSGDLPNSQELVFRPGPLKTKDLSVDIGTAGSLTLLMQSVLLPILLGGTDVTLRLKGGTDVRWSQPWDHFENILLGFVGPFAQTEPELVRRGYFPKGGGEIRLTFRPRFRFSAQEPFSKRLVRMREALPPMRLDRRGKLERIEGISHAAAKLKGVPERQADAARKVLESLGCPVSIRSEHSDSRCPGSGITLWAVFSEESPWPVRLGGDGLGERGKRAERVGRDAAFALLREVESHACADRHLADQLLPLIPFLPSARYVASEITPHCRANIHVIEKFLDVGFSAKENVISL